MRKSHKVISLTLSQQRPEAEETDNGPGCYGPSLVSLVWPSSKFSIVHASRLGDHWDKLLSHHPPGDVFPCSGVDSSPIHLWVWGHYLPSTWSNLTRQFYSVWPLGTLGSKWTSKVDTVLKRLKQTLTPSVPVILYILILMECEIEMWRSQVCPRLPISDRPCQMLSTLLS